MPTFEGTDAHLSIVRRLVRWFGISSEEGAMEMWKVAD